MAVKKDRQVDIMIDSGAHSVATLGVKVDLNDYIQWIKKHKNSLGSYVNLDVIPEKGAGLAGIEKAAKEGWDNFMQMCDAGLCPIPVFHYREDYKWLDKMVASGVPYIGLGGVSRRVRHGQGRPWLNGCFDIICNDEGDPLRKVHGFGITSVALMFAYPWIGKH